VHEKILKRGLLLSPHHQAQKEEVVEKELKVEKESIAVKREAQERKGKPGTQ
jgi:hypothetical protein